MSQELDTSLEADIEIDEIPKVIALFKLKGFSKLLDNLQNSVSILNNIISIIDGELHNTGYGIWTILANQLLILKLGNDSKDDGKLLYSQSKLIIDNVTSKIKEAGYSSILIPQVILHYGSYAITNIGSENRCNIIPLGKIVNECFNAADEISVGGIIASSSFLTHIDCDSKMNEFSDSYKIGEGIFYT